MNNNGLTMTQFYNQKKDEITKSLKTDERSGLTSEEANRRLDEYGLNKLEAKKRKSLIRIFLEQFKSFMIIILLIAAAISGVVGILQGEGLFDTFIILFILVLNA